MALSLTSCSVIKTGCGVVEVGPELTELPIAPSTPITTINITNTIPNFFAFHIDLFCFGSDPES
jgi:hypothetical protein